MYLRHLLRTISFWSAAGGTLALLLRRYRLAVYLWRLCGWGGIGAVYGIESHRRGVMAEPVALLKAGGLSAEGWRAFWWHFGFLVGAEVVDRRRS